MARRVSFACLLCSSLLGTLFIPARGQTYGVMNELYQSLFSNYTSYMRPLINQSERITITPTFQLISLIELDEIQQNVLINGLLGLHWKDELLTWNPSFYNGISYIAPTPTMIWKPRMAFLNTMDDRDIFEDDHAPVKVEFDGSTFWYPGGLFPALCSLDLRKFPFDQHSCGIMMAPFYMNASDMTFGIANASVKKPMFIPNGEWDLPEARMFSLPIDTEGTGVYNSIVINFILKRKSTFFIINIFFPILFLCALNVTTFMVPQDSGEKIGFSVTVLLAMAVYMGLVSDELPASSENMPYMTIYIFLLFTISVLCCVDNITIVWLHHKEEDEERKQKRVTKLNNVSSKLKAVNAFRLVAGKGEKSKVSPMALAEVDEGLTDQKTNEIIQIQPRDDKIKDEVNNLRANRLSGFGFNTSSGSLLQKMKASFTSHQGKVAEKGGKSNTTGADNRYINKYKNVAEKLNFYSGVVFSLVSVILTLIVLILITS